MCFVLDANAKLGWFWLAELILLIHGIFSQIYFLQFSNKFSPNFVYFARFFEARSKESKMALLTNLTIRPTFDQNKQNLEKVNWRIGENKFENLMNELLVRCECVVFYVNHIITFFKIFGHCVTYVHSFSRQLSASLTTEMFACFKFHKAAIHVIH